VPLPLPDEIAAAVGDAKRITNHAALSVEVEFLEGLAASGVEIDPTSQNPVQLALSVAQQRQHGIETLLGEEKITLAQYYEDITAKYIDADRKLALQLKKNGWTRELNRIVPRLRAAMADLKAYQDARARGEV